MNFFVLSGHGSESFAAFLNEVILQKNNAALITAAVITTHLDNKKIRYRVICAVATAAVINAALFL